MKKYIIIMVINLVFSFDLFPDTNFRVMSYNTLNFDGTSRLSDFQTVLGNSEPDILICQEISSEAGANAMLSVLNAAIGGYARADFILDTDINNMLYYKSSVGTLVSQDTIGTSPRVISEYVMNINGNMISFYSCHLKSSSGTANEAERLAAVTILRDHLNGLTEGAEFIIVGDMNFYTSSEDGYQKFIADETNNIGRAQDLCTEVGSWHDNASYAEVHSQSSRYEAFGYGASGGLDDKFDFIFGNYGINNGSGIEYNSNSFTSYGNDGAHFNLSVNDETNSAVPDSVADALYYASDHLPVYVDFTSISGIQTYLIISEYIEGSSNNKYLEIYNGTGNEVNLSDYDVVIYYNGSTTTGSTIGLSGVLSVNDVYVLANSSAIVWGGTPDQTSGSLGFNGDDVVALRRFSSLVDVIGKIGQQQEWGSGLTSTQDNTLRRKSSITQGDPDGSDNFDPSIEWDGYAQDTVDGLGSHTMLNPQITVVSPNGNEEWERGNSYDITWTSNDFTDNVKIELYKEAVRDYTELISSTDNDGLWQWNIPPEQSISSDYKIRISDANDGNPNDESDNFFSITGTQITTDLFISEYIEGSSYNKYLEIYNGTEASIDLAGYSVKIYSNGSSSPTYTINLSGTLIAGDVYIIAHSSATVWSGTPDLISYSLNYNGDDAVALEGISVNVDVIGQIGVQQVWGTGEVTTQNHTLRRKSEITEGDSDGYDVFDPTIEWNGYSQDTVDNLGFHIAGPLNAPTNVTIEISDTSVTINWDEVVGATLYHVYSSDNPYSGFIVDETGSFSNNSWTTSITSESKFYRVTVE